MKILKISQSNFKKIVNIALKAIEKGNILICPTDTVYGLITDATNKTAVKKLFKIKKRKTEKPIPIFVKNIEMAKKLALIGEKQEKFLKKAWPGKITAVLKRKRNCGLPTLLFGGKKTIGLRIPNYKLIKELLFKSNKPLTGTSANISGKPASAKIQKVLKQFKTKKNKPALVLDIGNLPKSKPSTVIDLTKKELKILRP